MKLTVLQTQKLAEKVLQAWKTHNVITVKVDEKKLLASMVAVLQKDLAQEANLDREVNKMLDQLERSHNGQFERHKMYPLLKQKMAKEKKIIL